jgi:hypothetical protein
METSNTPNPKPNPTDAEGHIRSAQQILKALQGSACAAGFFKAATCFPAHS